jgi:hypothetical protein
MSNKNNSRAGCKDVFHAFMVENSDFSGSLEFPFVKKQEKLPTRLIPFSKAISGKDYKQWVHFYEDDTMFERIWNYPKNIYPSCNGTMVSFLQTLACIGICHWLCKHGTLTETVR